MTTTTTATKERPIIMQGHSVRAILAGAKTQTRRLCKPQPGGIESERMAACVPMRRGRYTYMGTPDGSIEISMRPYAFPGDRLWVKETCWRDRRESGVVIYAATPEWGKYMLGSGLVRSKCIDGYVPTRDECQQDIERSEFWRRGSPLFMPRWASRLTLDVAAVRVERLNDISEADAIAEGCEREQSADEERAEVDLHGSGYFSPPWSYTAINCYQKRWDALNGKKPGGAWADSPWVFVVEFKRAEATR